MNLIELGKRIQQRRIYLGLKQIEVADAIGTSRSNYARYEAGSVDLNVSTLEALAKVLHVPKRYLDPEVDEEWAPEGDVAAFFIFWESAEIAEKRAILRLVIDRLQIVPQASKGRHVTHLILSVQPWIRPFYDPGKIRLRDTRAGRT